MDKISTERRSWNMSRIKSKNTTPEILVRKYLYSHGFRYRLHYPINGTPDIVFKNKRIAIFINGCFWHGHEKCKESHIPKNNSKFWREKIAQNIKRDDKNEDILESENWKVFTIYECEIEVDLNRALKPITKILTKP
jgi:DNA mismatch endonuclease (patch repair protein)